MKQRRILAELAFTIALLAPVASAQKPPKPPPGPTPAPTSGPVTPAPSHPTQPETDVVTFLMGRIATNDGTPIPTDVLVERICNEHVRQQVYASPSGDFSMQVGSRNDSFVDATADAPSPARLNDKTASEESQSVN